MTGQRRGKELASPITHYEHGTVLSTGFINPCHLTAPMMWVKLCPYLGLWEIIHLPNSKVTKLANARARIWVQICMISKQFFKNLSLHLWKTNWICKLESSPTSQSQKLLIQILNSSVFNLRPGFKNPRLEVPIQRHLSLWVADLFYCEFLLCVFITWPTFADGQRKNGIFFLYL